MRICERGDFQFQLWFLGSQLPFGRLTCKLQIDNLIWLPSWRRSNQEQSKFPPLWARVQLALWCGNLIALLAFQPRAIEISAIVGAVNACALVYCHQDGHVYCPLCWRFQKVESLKWEKVKLADIQNFWFWENLTFAKVADFVHIWLLRKEFLHNPNVFHFSRAFGSLELQIVREILEFLFFKISFTRVLLVPSRPLNFWKDSQLSKPPLFNDVNKMTKIPEHWNPRKRGPCVASAETGSSLVLSMCKSRGFHWNICLFLTHLALWENNFSLF